MYWQRLIVSTAILTFTLFVTRSTFAQNQMPRQPSLNDPLSDTAWPRIGSREIPELSSPRTEIERARDLGGADAQPGYVPQQPGAAAGTAGNAVSVEQLRHPLTRKGMKLIKKVESYLRIGQRAKAKEQLAEAMKEPSAAPYAHAILGTEYLRDGQPAAAVPELEDAAQVLPISGIHSNLGYALCLTGHGKRGRKELEEALRLDGDSAEARFLMGIVLLNLKSEKKAAEFNLKMAQDRVRSAHLALAVCHLLHGEKDAAEQQVRLYLGPDHEAYFPLVWKWASAAAADPHPAAAFGFSDTDSD